MTEWLNWTDNIYYESDLEWIGWLTVTFDDMNYSIMAALSLSSLKLSDAFCYKWVLQHIVQRQFKWIGSLSCEKNRN